MNPFVRDVLSLVLIFLGTFLARRENRQDVRAYLRRIGCPRAPSVPVHVEARHHPEG